MRLQFLGANRQVTGSCYLLETAGMRVLVDCGMFQERQFQERNWNPLPIDPKSLDVMLLTHGHLDHCGLTPKLVGEGFGGRILTTAPSVEVASIVMHDAARIQEEDAAYKTRRHQREGRRGAHPDVPLYTVADAEKTEPLLTPVPYDEPVTLNDQLSVRYCDAGHILGSAMLEVTVTEGRSPRRLLFSGDIGQWDKPLVRNPSLFDQADYVVMESTYGDREHREDGNVEDTIAEVINEACADGGNVIIPTFAVERAQELLYILSRLRHQKRIPPLPVFLDSPMAINVTEVFDRHQHCLDAEAQRMLQSGRDPLEFTGLHLTRTTNQSKSINAIRGTAIILAGSGMCTAGRVKHHLVANIERPESTVLFVGYQAVGTLGRHIIEGAETVRIHGVHRPVKAKVRQLHGLSAHADRAELLRWITHLKQPPKHVYLTHGEERAALRLAEELRDRHDLKVTVPEYQDRVKLK